MDSVTEENVKKILNERDSKQAELENLKGSKSEKAHAVGLELAKRALSSGVSKAKFDRGRFLYHGRVKSFADGLREAGMQL